MKSPQKNKKSLKLWFIVGAVALAVIIAVVLIIINKNEDENGDWASVVSMTEGSGASTQIRDENGNGAETVPTVAVTDSDGQTVYVEATDPDGSYVGIGETLGENNGTVPTVGNEDPYEQCLVSAMIVGVSMQYGDYEFLGIYTASDTPVYAHESSKGAYLIFNGDGQKLALKAVPLDGERPDRGTADIYVAALGYATYELVDPDSVPVGSLKEHKLEDLVDLISAYSLVSIIER